MTIREINDRIRECKLRINDLISVKDHSLNYEEDAPHINRMILNRKQHINQLENAIKEKLIWLNELGLPLCPSCGLQLKPVLYMRREPDGFYCSNCKIGFNDELKKTSEVL